MRARLATALLVLSVGAAACSSEDPEAGPTLPPITEAPSATPEPVPSEATAATPEGAAEFVRHFYTQVELAYREREPRYVADLSAQDCRACERFISSLTQLRKEGQRAEGVTYDIVGAEAPALKGRRLESMSSTTVPRSQSMAPRAR